MYDLIRPILFKLEPEKAHYFTLKLLKLFFQPFLIKKFLQDFPQKKTSVLGLDFPNPVGLAAGFDKNGDYIDPLQGLGFGFIEVGTVTPKPQSGNPLPRLFRIPESQALINRMGFNNLGVDHLVKRLKQHRIHGIIGVNIGKNTATSLNQAAEDYCYCLQKVYQFADYIAINISSPNSPGLRELQSPNYLHDLLAKLNQNQQELSQKHQRQVPLLIKIDPDLSDVELKQVVDTIALHKVAGIIATNTTIDHQLVAHLPHGNEKGGLSGEPLQEKSTRMIKKLNLLLEGQLPIIAVGGILSPEDAQAKFSAGASLIQIYTGLIYKGPQIIRDIISYL